MNKNDDLDNYMAQLAIEKYPNIIKLAEQKHFSNLPHYTQLQWTEMSDKEKLIAVFQHYTRTDNA